MTLRDEISTQDERNRGDKSKNMREEVLYNARIPESFFPLRDLLIETANVV